MNDTNKNIKNNKCKKCKNFVNWEYVEETIAIDSQKGQSCNVGDGLQFGTGTYKICPVCKDKECIKIADI